MKRYVIERDIPGVGANNDHREAARRSNAVMRDLGPDIQWLESHVGTDKVYCVYLAENEEIIREHSARSGIPITRITEIKSVIDPTSAG